MNELKLNAKWREILKLGKYHSNKESHPLYQNSYKSTIWLEKHKQLQKEAEILFATHQHLVDLKSNILERLAVDAAQAETQFSVAMTSHLEHLESLIELQKSRLETSLSNFSTDLMNLEMDFSHERTLILAKHHQDKAIATGILRRLDREFNESETDFKNEWNSLREDIKNKHLEEKHALRIQLDGTIEELWRQFQNALDQYTLNTEDRKKHFEELKAKDLKNSSEIDIQMKKLVQIQESIAHLKSKLNHNSQQHSYRIQSLSKQKQTLSKAFLQLKKHLYQIRTLHEDQLTKMIVKTSDVASNLENMKKVAENIINLAEFNAKLVDKDDLIVHQLFAQFHEANKDLGHDLPETADDSDMPETIKNIESFYVPYNKACLDILKLKHAIHYSKQYNAVYQTQLKSYIQGFTVNQDTLNHKNSLMMVNGKSNVQPTAKIGNKAPAVQDAQVIYQSYLKYAGSVWPTPFHSFSLPSMTLIRSWKCYQHDFPNHENDFKLHE